MFKQQSEARGELTTLTDEMLGNMKVVQAFGYEKEAEKRFQEINSRGWPDAALSHLLFFHYQSGQPFC